MTYYVNVYDDDEDRRVIARVEYTNNLDYLVNSDYQNGGTGRHKGITKLKNGQYVLIHGTQWQGERDYAEVISKEQALQEILDSVNIELLNDPRFCELNELMNETLIDEM